MSELLGTVVIGFVSGLLSGMFGVGGGIVTTPAIRLFLDAPALVAVGTPLVAIIPSTITGALSYRRRGLTDSRAGLVIGLFGSATAIAGAAVTRVVGGPVVLVATGALILYVAGDMIVTARRAAPEPMPAAEEADAALLARGALDQAEPTNRTTVAAPRLFQLAGTGVVTGFYSGFLGLGGGFVLVPMLTKWLHFPLKRAIGTSLVAIAVLSVPGAIAHALLGNVDWAIAAGLVVGVIPGAAIGARIAIGSSDARLRLGFAALLVISGSWLVASELVGMLR
jgi:hypothetical protein